MSFQKWHYVFKNFTHPIKGNYFMNAFSTSTTVARAAMSAAAAVRMERESDERRDTIGGTCVVSAT